MLDLQRHWYRDSMTFATYLLLPFSWLFGYISWARRLCYRLRIFKTHRFNVPVIVVGNITVGGTGKTPFAIWLAQLLKEAGYTPGIVSRGYGGASLNLPRLVTINDSPKIVGDEALLLARRSGCPVVVCVDRVNAVRELLKMTKCDVVISDDGLQHYRLDRNIEIALVDGARYFGNRRLLPAGPLREPVSRLNSVDFVVTNDGNPANKWGMILVPEMLVSLKTQEEVTPKTFAGQKVHAVAGIGHPERFFNELLRAGIEIIPHPFADHYDYQASDFQFGDDYPVLMTEKDAVKCEAFADMRFWYLAISTDIGAALEQALLSRLQSIKGEEKHVK